MKSSYKPRLWETGRQGKEMNKWNNIYQIK
jgi:hypothetical protein